MQSTVFTLWLLLCISNAFAKTITLTLTEAIEHKKIEAVFTSLGDHKGKAMRVDMKNISDVDIDLQVPAGILLASDDESLQDLMIVKAHDVLVEKRSSQKLLLYVVCTQHNNTSPGTGDTYTFNKMAEGGLLRLAEFINTKRFYGKDGAQNATWALLEDSDLSDVYDDDQEVLNALVEEMIAITGKERPWYNTQYEDVPPGPRVTEERTPQTLHANYRFVFNEDASISIHLFNEQGEIISTVTEGLPVRPGTITMKYKLVVNNMPTESTYYVRVYNGDEQLDERVVRL